MSDTVSSGHPVASSSEDIVLGGIGYALLFLAPFTCAVTALVAVALAYARRPRASEPGRSHYGFQIRTFWTCLVLAVLGLAALLFGLYVLYSDTVWAVGDHARGVAAYFAEPDAAAYRFHPTGVASLLAGLALGAAATIWMLVASVFGFVRLASNDSIRSRSGRRA